MANHKSAIKRNRQNIKRRDQNRGQRATVRTAAKSVVAAASNTTAGGDVKALLREAESQLASAAKKGLVHRRTARRKISRLAKMANKAAKKA